MNIQRIILMVLLLHSLTLYSKENIVYESNGYVVDHFQKNRNISWFDKEQDILFSEKNYLGGKKGMGYTRVTRLRDEKIIFEGVTPEFSKFYISIDGDVVGFSQSEYFLEPNLIIINSQGEIDFLGFANLYLEQFEENIKPDFSEYQSSFISAAPEYRLMPVSNLIDNFVRDSEFANEDKGEKIIIACGTYVSYWIDQVLAIEKNSKNEINGIWFENKGSTQFFDLNKHNQLLEKNHRLMAKKVSEMSNLKCVNSQPRSFFNGVNYSSWCETNTGQRVGGFQQWVKADDDDLDDLKQLQQESVGEIKIIDDYYFSVVGRYSTNQRVGKWSIREGLYQTTCSFLKDRLHGLCTVYYEDVKESSVEFLNGQAQGWEYYFYPDGSIETQQKRVNGLIDGTSLEFYENGQISCSAEYQNGIEHGQSCCFNNNGIQLYCREYKLGNITN